MKMMNKIPVTAGMKYLQYFSISQLRQVEETFQLNPANWKGTHATTGNRKGVPSDFFIQNVILPES